VLLIVITNNSLIVLGIPAAWQKVAVGALLLVAIGLPLLARHRRSRAIAAPGGLARTGGASA
jgi:simple sugar transport system permease protein